MAGELLGKKEDLYEVDWVKEQTKSALSGLKKDVLYTKNGDEVKFDVDTSLKYLKTLKDKKSYQEVMKQNPGATVMAVQILLKNKGYNIGKIDGILKTQTQATSNTMEAIKKFQRENGLPDDGAPGPDTIKKILAAYENGGGNAGAAKPKPATPNNPKPATPNKPKTPEKQAQNAEATLADLKNFNPYSVGNFDKNKNFVFKKGVEKSDSKGKYILVNGKKLYELGNNKAGIYYKRGIFSFMEFGQYVGGKRNGWGLECGPDGYKYVGQWKNDEQEGLGRQINVYGGIYEGQFKNGSEEGKGTMYYENGNKYTGEWKNGQREGKGTFYYKNGNKYAGEFKNDRKEGKGIFYFKNGEKYAGEFKNGQRGGKGIDYYRNGNKHFSGEMKDDKLWTGYVYDKDGKTILERWVNGKKEK